MATTPERFGARLSAFGTAGVPDVITTAIGGEDTSAAVDETDVLLGFESSNSRPPAQYDIEFVDWPFTDDDPDFEAHIDVVKREGPKYAVAPDVEDYDLSTVVDMADRLSQYVTEAVIVVPKTVHPSAIPERFRVGVPLANFGSNAPWGWDAYANCGDLHLLGGTPHEQLSFGQRVDGVASVDGASVFKAAQMGSIWAPTRNKHWHETGSKQMDYYERITTSLNNIIEAWHAQTSGVPGDYSVPMDPDEYEELHSRIESVYDDREQLIETEKAYRRCGARGAEPYIHPDDADCLKRDERQEFDVIDWEARLELAWERAEERVQRKDAETSQSDLSDWGTADQPTGTPAPGD